MQNLQPKIKAIQERYAGNQVSDAGGSGCGSTKLFILILINIVLFIETVAWSL